MGFEAVDTITQQDGSAVISGRIRELQRILEPFTAFFVRFKAFREAAGQNACDFMLGNPQDPPLEAYTESLSKAIEPRSAGWYAYTESLPEAREVVAASLRERLGVPFRAEDVAMTNAAMAALAVSMQVLTDRDDEVIIVTPPHFLYEPLIRSTGAVPVRVPMDPRTFDLDVPAMARAITPRTRAVLINSPHNPTGKIYPAETLRRLAAILKKESRRNGRPIYLISDEAYNRLVLDGRRFVTPTAFYPYSLLIYTYGKTLLAPSERIGYIALSPDMPDREEMMASIWTAQLVTGWSFPSGILQHALPDLEPLSIDLDHVQRKRDRMVTALREMGYELHLPEATFYLLVRSPLEDDAAFARLLEQHDVFVMPGQMFEMPGYFRISLTATDDMIERSLPVFARALRDVGDGTSKRWASRRLVPLGCTIVPPFFTP